MAEQPYHDFRKHTINTWSKNCDVCSKHIWGARKQTVKCKVCRMTTHRGNCMSKANTTVHCSQRLSTDCSIVENMKLKTKKAAIESIQDNIVKEETLKPHRVDAFLTFITRIPGYADNHNNYECFSGKVVAEINSENPIGSNLRYPLEATADAFSVLIIWIQKSCSFEEKITALKILQQISKIEENKTPMLSLGHTDGLTSILLPINSRPEDEITLDEAKYAHIIFSILRNICNTRERQLGFIDNNQLERIIFFLKILKRVEAGLLGIYKDRTNRDILRIARNEGYKLLEAFVSNFYDKDTRVTDYLCSRQTLDLIMDPGARSVIKVAPEINPSEIKQKKKTPL